VLTAHPGDAVGALCDNRDNNAMGMFTEPDQSNAFLPNYAEILRNSLYHWTKRDLLDVETGTKSYAEQLYQARFALMSHDTAVDPVFNYANLTAQRLFGLGWDAYTALPSRLSAEPVNRDERARLLAEVSANGYIDNYRGVRISSTGRRFRIDRAVVWNLIDNEQRFCGQAAMFAAWEFI